MHWKHTKTDFDSNLTKALVSVQIFFVDVLENLLISFCFGFFSDLDIIYANIKHAFFQPVLFFYIKYHTNKNRYWKFLSFRPRMNWLLWYTFTWRASWWSTRRKYSIKKNSYIWQNEITFCLGDGCAVLHWSHGSFTSTWYFRLMLFAIFFFFNSRWTTKNRFKVECDRWRRWRTSRSSNEEQDQQVLDSFSDIQIFRFNDCFTVYVEHSKRLSRKSMNNSAGTFLRVRFWFWFLTLVSLVRLNLIFRIANWDSPGN